MVSRLALFILKLANLNANGAADTDFARQRGTSLKRTNERFAHSLNLSIEPLRATLTVAVAIGGDVYGYSSRLRGRDALNGYLNRRILLISLDKLHDNGIE
jgi:hypothetical protein